MMERLLGKDESVQLAAALDNTPSVSVRINRKKVANPVSFVDRFAGYGVRPVPWCRSGFYLDRRPDFVHDPLLHAGTYYVQEAASMVYESIVESILQEYFPKDSSVRVLDLCAAPGGKSTAMLNALEGDFVLVANEYDRKRAAILKENLDKWGDPNVVITNSPTASFQPLEDFFDIVAVDAPCSGEGMMRREPVARTQWSEGLVAQCSALQRNILADAVSSLRPGGFLIFSTCTFNDTENEANVSWLASDKGLEQVGTPRHFYPHRETCEGLFVAVFRKPASLGTTISFPAAGTDVAKVAALLAKKRVRIVSAGIEKSELKGKLEIPSSRMVLARDYRRDSFPSVDLSREEALAYLRRNSLVLPPNVPTGYVAVCHEGYPLGLAKNIGSRANNLYPAEFKVRT